MIVLFGKKFCPIPRIPSRMSDIRLIKKVPWWPVLFLAVGLVFIIDPLVLGGHVPGNSGDSRFNLYVLEHFYQSLGGVSKSFTDAIHGRRQLDFRTRIGGRALFMRYFEPQAWMQPGPSPAGSLLETCLIFSAATMCLENSA